MLTKSEIASILSDDTTGWYGWPRTTVELPNPLLLFNDSLGVRAEICFDGQTMTRLEVVDVAVGIRISIPGKALDYFPNADEAIDLAWAYEEGSAPFGSNKAPSEGDSSR